MRVRIIEEVDMTKTSSRTSRLERARLWGGPRLGAELDGLRPRPEIPSPVP
jgi:hypothetical protein